MWQAFLTAFGLMLVLEGIMPFLNPEGFRKTLLAALKLDDATLRFIGISVMLVGVLIIYLVK
jgi:hypothetical protein